MRKRTGGYKKGDQNKIKIMPSQLCVLLGPKKKKEFILCETEELFTRPKAEHVPSLWKRVLAEVAVPWTFETKRQKHHMAHCIAKEKWA